MYHCECELWHYVIYLFACHLSFCVQTSQLLGFLNALGVRDGITGKMDMSVDGLPLSYHLNMLQTIKDVIHNK